MCPLCLGAARVVAVTLPLGRISYTLPMRIAGSKDVNASAWLRGGCGDCGIACCAFTKHFCDFHRLVCDHERPRIYAP